jgi:hypothetical protein
VIALRISILGYDHCVCVGSVKEFLVEDLMNRIKLHV